MTEKEGEEEKELARAKYFNKAISANIIARCHPRKTIRAERNELNISPAIGCNYLASLKMQSTGALTRDYAKASACKTPNAQFAHFISPSLAYALTHVDT